MGRYPAVKLPLRYFWGVCAFILIFSLSGCAILEIPVKVVEGTFGILGQLLKLIQKLPMPPPGVF